MSHQLTNLEYAATPDPPSRFIRAAQVLEDRVVTFRASHPEVAATKRQAVQESIQFTSVLLAYAVRGSGNISFPEIDLLRRYHLDSHPVFEEVDLVHATARSSPNFLFTIPAFLVDANKVGDMVAAAAMVQCIREMLDAIAAVDRVAEPRELEMSRAYLALIEASLHS